MVTLNSPYLFLARYQRFRSQIRRQAPCRASPDRLDGKVYSGMTLKWDYNPYVTFRPFGMPACRMNQIVFVLYNLFISLAVDIIHCILYFNFVMSSWCLRDLPVSGQITAFAISCKTTPSDFGVDGWLILVLAEIEKQ
jgi:hypothetical protein